MQKKLDNLKWKPMWVSHLGCIQGCLKHMNINISDAWLFGATGHAFILNIHEVVCPSGPTAWKMDEFFKLVKNLGCKIEGIVGTKNDSNFKHKQKIAWGEAKHAINENRPCYGWELDIPEYYVVYGYDDEGYYFSGPLADSGKGPKNWDELGDSQLGVLAMYSTRPTQAKDDKKIIKDALSFALEFSKGSEKWIYPKYKTNLEGYELWIEALEEDKANPFGMVYNSQVWAECRHFAVKFLEEAKDKLDNKLSFLFDQAIKHYQVVSSNLKKIAEAFPFDGPQAQPEPIDQTQKSIAAEELRKAKRAEGEGLKTLEEIVGQL